MTTTPSKVIGEIFTLPVQHFVSVIMPAYSAEKYVAESIPMPFGSLGDARNVVLSFHCRHVSRRK